MPVRDDSHRLLLKALSGHENGYRQWATPTEIIEQAMFDEPVKCALGVADFCRKVLQRVTRI